MLYLPVSVFTTSRKVFNTRIGEIAGRWFTLESQLENKVKRNTITMYQYLVILDVHYLIFVYDAITL